MLQLAPSLYFVTVVVAVSTVFDSISVQDINSETDGHDGKEDLGRSKMGEELAFTLEIGENCFELRKLFWSNTRKGDSKTVRIHPAHRGFIDAQRPIQSRYMKSALKL